MSTEATESTALLKKHSTALIERKDLQLNDGQMALYNLICATLKNKSVLKKEDAMLIYKSKVSYGGEYKSKTFENKKEAKEYLAQVKEYAQTDETITNIKGEGYKNYYGNWRYSVSFKQEWRDWQLERNFTPWFLRSLGTFIKKGYVTVIPLIDLS